LSHFTIYGVDLPDATDARIASLTVAAPSMLRWSYLVRRPATYEYIQRINVQQAAEHGYVPLLADRDTTARAISTRMELRKAIGLTQPESTQDSLSDHGFLVDPAMATAYLPVGLDHEELIAACRPGGQIEQAKSALSHPRHLECVLVSDDGRRRGVNIVTGNEVPVP
jgi:hypothetical protein